MIENADQYLKEWVGSVVSDSDISLTLPIEQSHRSVVGIYLLDMRPSPPSKGPKRPPLQIVLRYLVTSWAESPELAHAILSDLLFAAMEHAEFEVDQETLPITLWHAFGVKPCPAFLLRLPHRRERSEADIKLVNSPIEMKYSPMTSLEGQLVGPNNIPIANARIGLPSYRQSTVTDSKGRFWFSGVPNTPAVKQFQVQARGRQFTVKVEPKAEDQGPLIINFNPGEV